MLIRCWVTQFLVGSCDEGYCWDEIYQRQEKQKVNVVFEEFEKQWEAWSKVTKFSIVYAKRPVVLFFRVRELAAWTISVWLIQMENETS
jgi:hypothetical protein